MRTLSGFLKTLYEIGEEIKRFTASKRFANRNLTLAARSLASRLAFMRCRLWWRGRLCPGSICVLEQMRFGRNGGFSSEVSRQKIFPSSHFVAAGFMASFSFAGPFPHDVRQVRSPSPRDVLRSHPTIWALFLPPLPRNSVKPPLQALVIAQNAALAVPLPCVVLNQPPIRLIQPLLRNVSQRSPLSASPRFLVTEAGTNALGGSLEVWPKVRFFMSSPSSCKTFFPGVVYFPAVPRHPVRDWFSPPSCFFDLLSFDFDLGPAIENIFCCIGDWVRRLCSGVGDVDHCDDRCRESNILQHFNNISVTVRFLLPGWLAQGRVLSKRSGRTEAGSGAAGFVAASVFWLSCFSPSSGGLIPFGRRTTSEDTAANATPPTPSQVTGHLSKPSFARRRFISPESAGSQSIVLSVNCPLKLVHSPVRLFDV